MWRPVCSRAMRMAFSLASAPPLVKNTMSRSPGARSASSRASSPRLSLAMDGGDHAQHVGLLLDRLDHPRVLVADVQVDQLRGEVEVAGAVLVPEPASPAPPATDIGSIRPWADHEWKTWARSSR